MWFLFSVITSEKITNRQYLYACTPSLVILILVHQFLPLQRMHTLCKADIFLELHVGLKHQILSETERVDPVDGGGHHLAVRVTYGDVHHTDLSVRCQHFAQNVRTGQVLVGVIVVGEPAAGEVLQCVRKGSSLSYVDLEKA